jgi:hypothetical protein
VVKVPADESDEEKAERCPQQTQTPGPVVYIKAFSLFFAHKHFITEKIQKTKSGDLKPLIFFFDINFFPLEKYIMTEVISPLLAHPSRARTHTLTVSATKNQKSPWFFVFSAEGFFVQWGF